MLWLLVLPQSNKQRKKVVVAEVLSDLVVYTGSVKFVSFSHSREQQSACENTSMAEKRARKLVKSSGETEGEKANVTSAEIDRWIA